jgi:hypothetical protein
VVAVVEGPGRKGRIKHRSEKLVVRHRPNIPSGRIHQRRRGRRSAALPEIDRRSRPSCRGR